jgi:hypothetical protein
MATMTKVNLEEWTPEQIDEFEQLFRDLKKISGDEPLALTPEQRDIAVQLGLMPPLSVKVEVDFKRGKCRGLLRMDGDDVYRGAVYLVEEGK